MNNEITRTVAKIHDLCLRSIDAGEYTYEHDDELNSYCKILSANPDYSTWAPLLYELVEEFDENVDLTLGSPGPLVHTLENSVHTNEYRKFMLESLNRKPTGLVMGMALIYAVSSDEKRDVWVQIFNDVLSHDKSTPGAIEIANDALDNNWHGR